MRFVCFECSLFRVLTCVPGLCFSGNRHSFFTRTQYSSVIVPASALLTLYIMYIPSLTALQVTDYMMCVVRCSTFVPCPFPELTSNCGPQLIYVSYVSRHCAKHVWQLFSRDGEHDADSSHVP